MPSPDMQYSCAVYYIIITPQNRPPWLVMQKANFTFRKYMSARGPFILRRVVRVRNKNIRKFAKKKKETKNHPLTALCNEHYRLTAYKMRVRTHVRTASQPRGGENAKLFLTGEKYLFFLPEECPICIFPRSLFFLFLKSRVSNA